MLIICGPLGILLPTSVSAAQEGDFTYIIDVGAKVTGYTGTGGPVVIPATLGGVSVTTIDPFAFANNTLITAVSMPDSVTNIDVGAFSNCISITSVALSANLTVIQRYAFMNCTSLQGIVIPDSVTTIYRGAFSECRQLTSLSLGGALAYIDGFSFLNCTSLTTLAIPDSVTTIHGAAFMNCTSLTAATLSRNLTMLEDWIFRNCTNLSSVLMPYGIVTIRSSAFEECISLASMTIPASVITIMGNAFRECRGLTRLDLPGSLTTIGDYAFAGCAALTDLALPAGLLSMGEGAFGGLSSLKDVTIPASVGSLPRAAFIECSSLANVTLQSGITSIGDVAFGFCPALQNVTLPATIGTLGMGVFYQCTSLQSIGLPQTITSIDNDTFFGCSSLIEISLPANVSTIGERAFFNCTSLRSIAMPQGLAAINSAAFSGCSLLENITLPSNIMVIGDNALGKCAMLNSISFLGTAPPSSISISWIAETGPGLQGHAYRASSFPLPGADLMGLPMGVYLTIIPDSPTEVNVSGGRESVLLTWTAPAYDGDGAIQSYRIYRSGSLDGDYALLASLNDTSYDDKNVSGGRTYWYRLTAVNAAGESVMTQGFGATAIAAADDIEVAAAVAVSSGIAIAAAAIASQATAGASGAAPGTFAAWWQKFLLVIKKMTDFLYGYAEDRATDYVFDKVNKVEPERGVPVYREGFLSAFSLRELGVIAFASVVMGLTFLIAKRMQVLDLQNLLVFIVVAGFALTLHDMAHRYVAWKHKTTSEYQVWWLGSLIMFFTAGLFGVVYATPSRLRLDKKAPLTKRQKALIHGAGPLMSFTVFLAFALLIPMGSWALKIGILGCSMNLLVAVYTMMPFDPMDGKKVFDWNRWLWLAAFLPLLVLYFALTIYVF